MRGGKGTTPSSRGGKPSSSRGGKPASFKRSVSTTGDGAKKKVEKIEKRAPAVAKASKKTVLSREELARVKKFHLECLVLMNRICPVCHKLATRAEEFEWGLCTIVTDENHMDKSETFIVHLSQLTGDGLMTFDDIRDGVAKRRVSIVKF
jgi:hypothetical protein